MRRLSLLLTDPHLAEAATRAALACDVPASVLSNGANSRQSAPLGDVLLTDLPGLRILPDLSALDNQPPLLWLAVSQSSELFEVLPETSAAVVGLIRAAHVTEDVTDAVALLAPRPPVCRDAQELCPDLVRLDACYTLANRRESAFAAARMLRALLEDQAGADAVTAARCAAAAFEAFDNAMFRGNLELSPGLRQTAAVNAYAVLQEQRQRQTPYRDRRVWVTTRITPEAVQLTVRDEGPGFDVPGLCARGLDGDSHSRAGRGSLMMRYFCSDVRYNDAGNEVTLVLPITRATSSLSPRSTPVPAPISVR